MNSIEQYNKHFNSFKISEELTQFLNNYGEKNIKPNYENFVDIANDETKYTINFTIEENSIDYILYQNYIFFRSIVLEYKLIK